MSRDTDDLQALFDSVARDTAAQAIATASRQALAPVAEAPPPPPVTHGAQEPAPDVFQSIGVLTRSLHDALRELGYEKVVESAAATLPDARDRLAYIATLTGKAAERALAAAEVGLEQQKQLAADAAKLAGEWEQAFAGALSLDEFKAIAVATRSFFTGAATATAATSAQLTEIMMAQDFHDLTGQVIQRVVKLAQDLEQRLLKLLIETTPPEKRPATEEGWLTGPAMNTAGRTDIVTSQAQVDDLLESLGF